METPKIKWYVVTIWDGKGSGEKLRPTTSLESAMRLRQHRRKIEETEYTVSDFSRNDIKCSTMDVYLLGLDERLQDNEPILTLTWY